MKVKLRVTSILNCTCSVCTYLVTGILYESKNILLQTLNNLLATPCNLSITNLVYSSDCLQSNSRSFPG